MIARLQRTLVLLALAASAGWAMRSALAGRWLHAFDLAFAMLAVYAAVIGAEFFLMTIVARRTASAGRPRFPELFVAAFGELRASARTFLWRQPFAAERWPDILDVKTQGRRGVLLVHGYFCNRGFWNDWLRQLSAQGTPCIAVTLEPAFGTIAAYASRIDAAIAELERRTALPPIVVAHSMGGLAVRYWWAACATTASTGPSEARLLRLLTLGTPHRGTWLARLAFSANARQMRLDSPWLRELAEREPHGHCSRTTCYYSRCDNIVFPAESATLRDARHVHLQGVAHVAMAEHPEPYAELQRLLNEVPSVH